MIVHLNDVNWDGALTVVCLLSLATFLGWLAQL